MSKKLLMNNYSENGLVPVTDGLVCWLDARDITDGNNTWKDRSGNGNDGLLRGFTFDKQTNGRINNSLVFDGQECNVLVELKTAPLFEGNKFTIIANAGIPIHTFAQRLFQRRYTGRGGYDIMYLGSSGKSTPDVNSTKGNKIQFASYSFGGVINQGVATSSDIIDGTRKDVAITLDNANAKLFIDGVFNAETLNHTSKFDDYNPYIILGATPNGDSIYTNIGERSKYMYNSLKIYNRTLTEEEIIQNYLYEQAIKRGE